MAVYVTVSLDELRAGLAGLAYSCPVEHCNPKDCPLFLLRKLPAVDRLTWFETLNQREVQYLAAYHHVCMNWKKESSRSAVPTLPTRINR